MGWTSRWLSHRTGGVFINFLSAQVQRSSYPRSGSYTLGLSSQGVNLFLRATVLHRLLHTSMCKKSNMLQHVCRLRSLYRIPTCRLRFLTKNHGIASKAPDNELEAAEEKVLDKSIAAGSLGSAERIRHKMARTCQLIGRDHGPHGTISEAAFEAVSVEERHEQLEIFFLDVVRRSRHQQEVSRNPGNHLPQLIALRVFDFAAEVGEATGEGR